MNNKMLERVINGFLNPCGFKKKGTSWYREQAQGLEVFNLQKSDYGGQYYVNLAIVPSGMDVDGAPTPQQHKIPISIRLTAIVPEDQRREIEAAFDLERGEVNDNPRCAAIGDAVNQFALPFFEAVEKVGLKAAIETGMLSGGAISLRARKHLGLE